MKTRLLLFILSLMCLASLNAQITTVGLIGSGTTGDDTGWSTDIPMVQTSDSTWSLTVSLFTGAVKFRANNDWAINWGDKTFPTGIGTQDGPNIPTYPGDYVVTFNSNSGAYYFDVDSDIGIIGSATPGGWDNDTDMYIDPTDTNQYYITLDLVVGEAKFRQNDAWAVNWGAADFPSGVAIQDGPNVPIAKAGTYEITFDKSTGEYNFAEQVSYKSIGIIGSSTPGGWDTETAMIQDANNPDIWKLDLVLLNGEAKFRADSSWTVNWGNIDFPSGVGILDGPNIPVDSGEYRVTFNAETAAYNFQAIGNYSTIGIIGDATPGGWDNDTDLVQDPLDKTIWTVRLTLTDGEAKFRANDDWAVNWGSGDFPSGTGEQDGANIPVVAGDYKIRFNTLTGEYNFELVLEYGKISLVGRSGPFGDWPGADDSRDFYLTKDANDGNLWTATGAALTDASLSTDGGVKFRAEAAWTINWGSPDFPSGVGVQDGPNILCTAGTWDIVFHSDVAEYLFALTSSVPGLLKDFLVIITPNPASDFIVVGFPADSPVGNLNYSLMDATGKKIITGVFNGNDEMKIDVTSLRSGNYFLQLSNESLLVGKKVVVLK